MSEERIILEPGDAAPSFDLLNQHGERVSLDSYAGTGVILFFYPAAMTPGCTKQACDFRDSVESLQAAGYAVVGISPDEPEKQKKFADRDELTYHLLSDPEKVTLNAYGAFGDKSMYGKIVRGVIRSTFVISPEGKIEHALYNVKATGHVARVRKMLGLDAA